MTRLIPSCVDQHLEMKIEEAVKEEVAIAFLIDLGIPQEITENEGKQFL